MDKKIKITLFLIGLIVVIFGGFALLGQKSPVNIFDATIEDIDYENIESFVAQIDTSNIAGARENPMRKIIKLDEATEWTAYNQDEKKEWSTSFIEAKKGDYILVFSAENPESINDIEEFTALKVMIFK